MKSAARRYLQLRMSILRHERAKQAASTRYYARERSQMLAISREIRLRDKRSAQ